MFDRENQPTWLKLVNLLAVVCIILLVFIPLADQPVWLTSLLLVLFVLIAGVNFAIQFRDLLFRKGESKSQTAEGLEQTGSEVIEDEEDASALHLRRRANGSDD